MDKSVLEQMRAAVEATEGLSKTLGNQKTIYGLTHETIVALREELFYLGELRERCLGRLVRPEFVRSKQMKKNDDVSDAPKNARKDEKLHKEVP